MISGFRREVNENCALVDYYAATSSSSSSFLEELAYCLFLFH